jgi:hypothetical protein
VVESGLILMGVLGFDAWSEIGASFGDLVSFGFLV